MTDADPTSPRSEIVAKEIHQLVASIDSGAPLDAQAQRQALEKLEIFECWQPFFRLLKRSIDDPKIRSNDHFVRLAKVQNLYLEDIFEAAKTCARMVEQLHLSYRRFAEQVLPQVIEFEDWTAEATILSAVQPKFRGKDDQVACLERLTMLFEKKTHNNTELTRTYEALLALDPANIKALRYYKLLYTQDNSWREVIGILKALMNTVRRPQELHRYAQELAAIHLYQLDQAADAVKVVELYCAESTLDTSTILYDAYNRLGDWRGCLKVLRQCFLGVDTDESRAVLHLKMASLHEQLRELEESQDHYAKAAKYNPQLLDAAEGMINIALVRKDWAMVRAGLLTLAGTVKDARLASQLTLAAKRLADGLEHAQRA